MSSRSQTPPPRRSPPPRTPDSTGLTPSSRRSRARQRTNSPSAPPILILPRPQRSIYPRQFLGDTPTPSPPGTKPCSRASHIKPLADYIDEDTGKECNDCKACRIERANERRRQRELAEALVDPSKSMYKHTLPHVTLAVTPLPCPKSERSTLRVNAKKS